MLETLSAIVLFAIGVLISIIGALGVFIFLVIERRWDWYLFVLMIVGFILVSIPVLE